MNAIHVGKDEWVTLKPVHDTGQALWGPHGPTVTRLLQSYLLATNSHLVHSPAHRLEANRLRIPCDDICIEPLTKLVVPDSCSFS